MSPAEALPDALRREIEDRQVTDPDRPIDIVVEGAESGLAALRAAVARVAPDVAVRELPLVDALAGALRPADILRLAVDPAVRRITPDRPEHAEL